MKDIAKQDVDKNTTFIFYYLGHAMWQNQGPHPDQNRDNHLLVLEPFEGGHYLKRTTLLSRLKLQKAQ